MKKQNKDRDSYETSPPLYSESRFIASSRYSNLFLTVSPHRLSMLPSGFGYPSLNSMCQWVCNTHRGAGDLGITQSGPIYSTPRQSPAGQLALTTDRTEHSSIIPHTDMTTLQRRLCVGHLHMYLGSYQPQFTIAKHHETKAGVTNRSVCRFMNHSHVVCTDIYRAARGSEVPQTDREKKNRGLRCNMRYSTCRPIQR